MKRKIIFSVILSAMLLTACGMETPIIEDIETSDTTVPQNTETVIAVTTSEDASKETSFVLGSVAETAAETVSETSAETIETVPPKIENISGDVELDFQTVDIGSILPDGDSYGRLFILSDTAALGTPGGEGDISFFDLDEPKFKGKVSSPEGWRFNWYYNLIEGSGDILCTAGLYRYNDEEQTEYAALVIRRDFSTEVVEEGYEKALAVPVGSRNISTPYDIIDADSGTVLVEGVYDDSPSGFGNISVWYDHKFAIDDDRFVYRACGIEWMPSFGYYDLNRGTAVDFPNSQNRVPVGCHNGKIYAKETWWDGNCQGDLYTFDLETLGSEHFMSSIVEFDDIAGTSEYMEYYMPPSGEYIVGVYQKRNYENRVEDKTVVYIISSDSGAALSKCEFNSSSISSETAFIGDDRFALKDGEGGIIVFDVTI